MKLVLRTFFFHLLCIFVFSHIYSGLAENFSTANDKPKKYIDFLLLSTTLQASVGATNLQPMTDVPKMIMIFQQMIMLFTNVITLYFFTL